MCREHVYMASLLYMYCVDIVSSFLLTWYGRSMIMMLVTMGTQMKPVH